MTDVSARLRALAQDAATQHAEGPGLPVEEMAARARRNRAQHTVRTIGVAAAVAVALAVGGTALARSVRTPVPADPPTATPSASPTPTASPSPTTPAVVLPTGVPDAPFGTCGSLVGSALPHPLDDELLLEADEVPTTLPGGEPLPFAVSLGGGSTSALVQPAAGPRVVVTRDDVVVAVTDAYGGARTDWTSSFEDRGIGRQVGDAGMTVCDAPGASTGAPLPAGEYAVWFVGEAASVGDEEPAGEVTAPDPALLRSIVLGPQPLTIEGTASAPVVPAEGPLDESTPPFPMAEEAAPPAPTTTGPWRLVHASGPIEMAAADLEAGDPEADLGRTFLDVPATLTHVGPGRSTMHLDGVVHYWLVQDGKVVATTYAATDRYALVVDLGPGHGDALRPAPEPVGRCERGYQPTTCDANAGPVPPGEYTLLPGVVLHTASLWQAGTGARQLPHADGAVLPWVVLGDPIPLTLR